MKVNINSNFSLGMTLPKYVEEKTEFEVSKYFDSAINASVFFSKEGSKFKVNIVINDGSKRGIVIKSSAESDDIYHCFDMALSKATRQLRKNKTKMRNYRKKISELKARNSDLPYIIADRWIIKDDFDIDEDDRSMKQEYNFTVVQEKEAEIEELSVDEAIMKMDLIDLPAYMFINRDNGLMNVVYKRSDGNISWINPKIKK